MYETSVSHLDNPASVGVHILENNGKVNYFETTCVLKGAVSCFSLVSLRAELGPIALAMFYRP